ncbi:DUF2059 domain-containing protein [Undibacterium sp. LX40W]|uniref:DUF2059 domain-containing protein n=1 Tax=Undibacterium nitidum TaxID=2762298 RepID=A0A923HKV4_9BURK|nr:MULTISPECIES: DUF2059 domain-containing protein [Undibacterium]MBC3881515.1 DUF2059 domain-containing protein [Undibacterium nitidum]MBC3891703.1 DUF2059 domain-containing protein [Undibacterium sp. LX40W]
MNNALRSFVVLLGFAPCFVASADTTTGELAKQFVALMRYSEQHIDYQSQCIAAAKAVTPESLMRQNPDRFYGIRPGSKLWPEVVKAYELYYQQACERPTQSEFLDAMARAYEAELSSQELREAIRFYSTASGQRLISAHKIASRNFYQELGRLNAKQIPIADANFNRRLNELAKKATEK